MDFYYALLSAPCRGALLTARALGVELTLKPLNIFEGEQNKPEFLAINPQHCVPTLVDGDLKLWESRAISCYLANKYGKDDTLYPKDPKARSLVDKLLYFDIGTLYLRFGEYVYPVMFGGASPAQEKLVKIQEALGWLNGFLEGVDYVAGSSVTIADHAIVASVSSFAAFGIDMSKHPNVVAWLARCKSLPGYDENEKGAQDFGTFAKSKFP